MTHEEIIKSAAAEGMVGNWGLGNEYEIQALLTKYGLPADYITQDFTMDQFDSDSVKLASAMTYNELGLVKNDYDGGYGYGDTVSTIDMNDEGVAMLEDNLFTSKAFAEANPNTVKAFVSASMKGWAYACEHPDEAAEIVFEAGSSVSSDHQAYMASEVAKLVTTDMSGNTVPSSDVGNMDEAAMQQTLDLAKQYIILEDSAAKDNRRGVCCARRLPARLRVRRASTRRGSSGRQGLRTRRSAPGTSQPPCARSAPANARAPACTTSLR